MRVILLEIRPTTTADAPECGDQRVDVRTGIVERQRRTDGTFDAGAPQNGLAQCYPERTAIPARLSAAPTRSALCSSRTKDRTLVLSAAVPVRSSAAVSTPRFVVAVRRPDASIGR